MAYATITAVRFTVLMRFIEACWAIVAWRLELGARKLSAYNSTLVAIHHDMD